MYNNPSVVRSMLVNSLGKLVSIALAAYALESGLHAQVAYDSGGFEPLRFVPGNLEGQDSPPLGQGPWMKDGGTSTAVLQSAVTNGGTQAVRLDRAADATGDTRWFLVEPFTPGADSIFRLDFDMNVLQSTTTSFGPAFGVELYGLSATNDILLIGSLTVDAKTGDVLYQAASTGILTETGAVVSLGAFNQFTISADFGMQTYTVAVDGAPRRTEPFVDSGVARFNDATISTFAAAGDPAGLAATGTAFFDNYRFSAVPEPSTTLFLAIAVAGLGMRRRQRS